MMLMYTAQFKGKYCEMKKKIELATKGCLFIKLPTGADLIVQCPGKKPYLLEIKCNHISLTHTERETKKLAKLLGIKFKTEMVGFP